MENTFFSEQNDANERAKWKEIFFHYAEIFSTPLSQPQSQPLSQPLSQPVPAVAGKKGFFSQAVINLLLRKERKTFGNNGHVAIVSIGEDRPHYLLPSSYTPILISLGN